LAATTTTNRRSPNRSVTLNGAETKKARSKKEKQLPLLPDLKKPTYCILFLPQQLTQGGELVYPQETPVLGGFFVANS
jgi:hypothetical protein